MPIPTYDELTLPMLRLAAEQTWTYRALIKRISDDFRLTESERRQKTPDGSSSLIDDQVHRTRTSLKDQGFIEKSRETYLRISVAGKQRLASDFARTDERLPLQSSFSKIISSQSKGQNGNTPEASVGLFSGPTARYEEQIRAAAQSLDEHFRDLILSKIHENSPVFLERLIINLMKRMDYGNLSIDDVEHLGGKADGGVDGVIYEDHLGLDRVYLQAKRYQDGVVIGPEIVRAFIGSLSFKGAKKGVLVTTSSFSRQAQEEAARSSDHKVVLIDGKALATLMVKFKVGINVTETIEIKRFDVEFFDEGSTGELL